MENYSSAAQNVAANVRRIRNDHQWSLAEVSEALGKLGYPMSLKTLSKLETGERGVDVDDLAALAEVLRVDVRELMTDPSLAPLRALTEQVEEWADAMDAVFEHHKEAEDYEAHANSELAGAAEDVPAGWDVVRRHLEALGKAGVPWIAEALTKAIEQAEDSVIGSKTRHPSAPSDEEVR